MNEKNVRLTIVLAVAIPVLIIIGIVSWRYINYHYLPMRQARPILEKLSTGNPQEIQKAAYIMRGLEPKVTEDGEVRFTADIQDHQPLEGVAVERVEKKILEILPSIEDEKALERILQTIVLGQTMYVDGNRTNHLDFSKYGDEEWNSIKDAADRFNDQTSTRREFRVKYKDGEHTLQYRPEPMP